MLTTDIIGKGWAFPPRPGIRGTLFALVEKHHEIEQAIHIILYTAPGERVMRPEFGCRIHELVFAPNNAETAALARRYVEEALRRWEPRIELTRVDAYPAFARPALAPGASSGTVADQARLNATLIIEVDYIVKATNDPRSLVFPFYLIPEE